VGKTFAVIRGYMDAPKYLGISPVVPADTRHVARSGLLGRESPETGGVSLHVLLDVLNGLADGRQLLRLFVADLQAELLL